ncbi:uncharacterized protein LOC143338391 [Chaetodon auriga]|uniref:uncharacterized protein LOC143338391 n=1 Tax=Chaetodon auriga TaxID=39042 RepID=UPI004032E555
MQEKGDTEKVQKLEDMKSRVDEGVLAALRYKLTAAVKEAMKNDHTSLRFKHIISKSVLVQSGSPTRYQLTPKKENIGSLRRMTLGEKNLSKTNKTILLVGETEKGKSTLVNALVNYAMGVDWEDNVWFEIVEDESSQSGSQKSDVVVYQVFGFEGKTLPYSLTVIDTPGFGDTRGTEGDVTIAQRLLDLFCSDYGVHEIDAVGLVLKATENRLSDRLRYIFDSVSSLFGKDMEKNIVVLVTHSDGRRPENALKALQAAHIQCAKDEKNQPVYFLYNNCQDADRTEDIESLQQAVRITTKGMSQFTDFLEKTEAQKLEITVDVLKERIQLTACIQNLQDRTEMTGLKQKEVQQTQEALRENEQEMKNNENFTEEVNEDYKVKESVNGGRRWWWCGLFYKEPICCPVCEENCQYPGYPMIRSPGHSEVMKDGCCTVCTRKCPELHHVKENWIYVNKTRKVQKTIDDMRKKYEESKTNCEETTKLLEHLERNLEELQREKDQILDESFQHVVTLEHIALNVNSLSTFVHLDFLIEKMQEKGDTEKVQKLEDMKSRVDEGVLAALRYKLTAAVKEAMKNDHTSLRFKHIISKSVLVQSGSPTRYQLTPKKENIGSLRRMTLGEKNLSKTNKTILLVGETEKGKSTLVNALVNYAMGVDWEDNVWFEIVEDESSQSGSQKSDVVVYQVFGFEGKTLPYSLTVIDTPGFGDTRGTEGDVTIAQRLLDLFCSDYGVHEIDAVGLVLKATENRLSDRLRYIFDSVSSLFGKDMEKNIVVLVTHSDGRRPENALKALQAAHIQCAKDEKNQPVYFLYNNCQDADRTEDIESLQQAVRITTKGMSQFTDFLEKTEAQKLEITVDVLKERIQLTACIQNLQDRTEMTGLKQKEVQQTQEALRENEQEMKNNENFTEEVNEDYKVKESVNGGRRWWWCGLFYKEPICCPVCEENCQYPGYPMIRSPGHSEVMKDGCCTVCTRKCPELHHVKENWIYVNKTRKVQKTIDDMRKNTSL